MAAENQDYFFSPLVLTLLPRQCHDEFFFKFNFLDVPCLKIALSKGLGYGIILGSVLVKVPQIIKLLRAGNAIGLSLLALYLEMFVMTSTMSYSLAKSFPFSSWGEAFFMSVQNLLIIILCYYFNRKYPSMLIFLLAYCGIAYALCSGITPIKYLTQLQTVSLPVMSLSKVIQIFQNFRNGHTGQLSAVTLFLLLGGSTARIFTSIQETGDLLFLSQYLIGCALNAILWGQMLYYWNVNPVIKSKSD